MKNKNSPIMFYKTNEEYSIFSNVTNVPLSVNIDGKNYNVASSEAIYQAMKDINHPNAQWMLTDPKAFGGQVQKMGNPIQNKLFIGKENSPPNTFKEQLMLDIIYIKATQNPSILKALLETGDREIIENTSKATYDDPFWGNGLNRNGRNALGKIWMQVRDQLRYDLNTYGYVNVRHGLSQTTAEKLGHSSSSLLSGNVITQSQLDNYKPITKADGNFKNQTNSTNVNKQVNLSGGATAVDRIKAKIQGANNLKIERDDKNQQVVKVYFNTPDEAKNFSDDVAKNPKNKTVPKVEGNCVILSQRRAQKVFEKLDIAVHGRTKGYKMIDALVHEIGPKNQQQSTYIKPFNFFQHLVRGFRAPCMTDQEVLNYFGNKTGVHPSNFRIEVDVNNNFKKVMKVSFDNPTEAETFASEIAGFTNKQLPNISGDTVILGEDRCRKLNPDLMKVFNNADKGKGRF